jgi:hypothetical protein
MLRFRNTSFGILPAYSTPKYCLGSTPRRVQFESLLGDIGEENSLELSADLCMECLLTEVGIDTESIETRLATHFIVSSDFHGQNFAYFQIPRWIFIVRLL